MKRTFFSMITICCCLYACSTKDERPAAALDTGREFIRATLDGDLEKAESFLLDDSLTRKIFESYRDFYQRLPADTKASYKKASYTINNYRDVNDSVTIINYSNDFMNRPMDIKLVKKAQSWGIDFAYTSGDTTNRK